MEFFRQEYWSGLPFPPPGFIPGPGIEPTSPMSHALQADSFPLSLQGSPRWGVHILQRRCRFPPTYWYFKRHLKRMVSSGFIFPSWRVLMLLRSFELYPKLTVSAFPRCRVWGTVANNLPLSRPLSCKRSLYNLKVVYNSRIWVTVSLVILVSLWDCRLALREKEQKNKGGWGRKGSLEQLSPTFFGTRDWFHGRQFFCGLEAGAGGDGFRMIPGHYIYCLLYCIIISAPPQIIRHLIPKLGGPLL